MTLEELQAYFDRSPYLGWLGLKALALEEGAVEIRATWRPEWVANPKLQQTQGGILAALVDAAGDFALFKQLGRPVPTIDMRVDYHRMAKQGDLIAKGRVVRLGRQLSVCEAQVLDLQGALIASGRGVYLTAPQS